MSIEQVLACVQAELPRLTPGEALAAAAGIDSLIVDTRPEAQRRAGGEVPGAIVIERNHLEWRLDPGSSAHIPEASSSDIRWIVMCDEGYSSSLAAQSLRAVGLWRSTDVVGGFQAWKAAGLPVDHPALPARPRGPGEGPQRRSGGTDTGG